MSAENNITFSNESCRRMPAMSSEVLRTGRQKNVVSRGRFFIASLSFLLLRASLVSSLALVAWILLASSTISKEVVIALAVSGVVLVASGLNVVTNARRVTCPLCRASLFMSSRGLTKPNVPKVFGCSKTPLAFSLLTMPQVMSCPCCAEKVRLTRSL